MKLYWITLLSSLSHDNGGFEKLVYSTWSFYKTGRRK
jgi:hypothetical protein